MSRLYESSTEQGRPMTTPPFDREAIHRRNEGRYRSHTAMQDVRYCLAHIDALEARLDAAKSDMQAAISFLTDLSDCVDPGTREVVEELIVGLTRESNPYEHTAMATRPLRAGAEGTGRWMGLRADHIRHA